MDFRMYDNAIGRFHNIDKMTDIMPSLSPYRFAFNNPVLWGDPTGLLESGGGDDEEYFLQGQEVVITPDSVASEPASFNYSLIPSHIMNDPRRPTLEQYNKHNGTNYQSFKEYYNAEYYQPARKKMMQERNQAGRTVVGTLTVLATAGVGTAYALPVLVSCSPAIQSTVATLVTNPSVQQIGLNVGSQLWVNGGDINKVNIVEGLMSGISGAGAVSLGELVNINVNSIKSGDFIEKPSFGKTSVGVVGGLASYGYGEATDTFLKGTGTKGKIIGTYFKFLVESATNAAPNLVPNEN